MRAFQKQVERQIERMGPNDSVGRPLEAGQRAPFFALADQHGDVVRSADILARGPLIVSFFRGPWCPHCNEELAELAEAYPEVREACAEVVAVTPQSAANVRTYGDKHPVPFLILIDADFSVAFSFGVVYTVPEYLRDLHKKAFPSDVIPGKTGNPWRRPIPARFVIATDGCIIDANADTDRRADDAIVRAFTSLEAA